MLPRVLNVKMVHSDAEFPSSSRLAIHDACNIERLTDGAERYVASVIDVQIGSEWKACESQPLNLLKQIIFPRSEHVVSILPQCGGLCSAKNEKSWIY
jgi:hypothetical protein